MTAVFTSVEGAGAVERRYREFLARWPVPSEQFHVPTREGDTFVVASGPRGAPPVVLLHGSASNSAMWLGDVATWSEHFRVYAVDSVGEPGLSAPSRPVLASAAPSLWLDDVLSELGVERPSLVGCSLGGWQAVDYATRYPGNVARLALLCPAGIGRRKWRALLAAAALAPFGRRGLRAAMTVMLGSGWSSAWPDFVEFMLLVNTHFRPRWEVPPTFDDGSLRRLSMPVLAVVGDKDAVLDSAGTADRLAASVPHADVRLLPGVGHVVAGQSASVLEFFRTS